MSYGQAPYGQSPYGGVSFDLTGPSLVSTVPTDNSTGISSTTAVTAVITSPSTFDPFSVNVTLNGLQAVVASTFLPGYSGTILFDGVNCTITISGHPDFPGGTLIPASFVVTDLAELSGTFSFAFNTTPGTVLLSETLGVVETPVIMPGHALTIVNLDATTVQVSLSEELRIDDITDVARFLFMGIDGGVPLWVSNATPGFTTKQTGTAGATGTPDANPLFSHVLTLDGSFSTDNIGDYITFTGPTRSWNQGVVTRIVGVISTHTVQVDASIFRDDPRNGSLAWTHTSAVQTLTLTVNKATNGKTYGLVVGPFLSKTNGPVTLAGSFVASVPLPQLASATFFPDGFVLVAFGEAMRSDGDLTSAAEYAITGPSTVEVASAAPIDETSVLLRTTGLAVGSYTLTVNASGTPKDVAGNPIDPSFNTGIFTAAVPLAPRSIFTDRGPIAKPKSIVASGSGATLSNFTDVTLPGANLSLSHVGLYVSLTTTKNGGTYRIAAVLGATKATLLASFSLPDPQNGSIAWQLIDPQNGQIADDPADVMVTVNNSPVTPTAVLGLLGQIVLPTIPAHGSSVKVSYSWINNPTVDVRRLNSKEFRLNAWNRDVGLPTDASNGHKYRFNNTLVQPTEFVAADMQAVLSQPLQRDLKYRAYERAYTAVLNDPTLLLLNSPTHSIAFPPLQRIVTQTFISYEPNVLPENDANPWTRFGNGTASVVAGELVVQDTQSGPFPAGAPIYWSKTIDLTFPHVFAATWQVVVNSVPTLEGVFTGIAAGFSDSQRAFVVGFLMDGSTAKVGFFTGGDPTSIASWTGGIDVHGNPSGAPVALDWTIVHSFRIFRGTDQVVKLYIDGAVTESLRLASSGFLFLSDLHDPFNSLEGVFFGSLSYIGTSTSTWDFVRYLILPTNPIQSSPSVFVSYEANTTPEKGTLPWTPVGAHGTETILGGDFLLLDSTSATTPSVATLAGLVDGDFRGFVRIEPLLSNVADVTLDINLQIRTFTHGITPNAVMAAIDDGDRLTQLCFLSDTSAPKLSYGGRSFPDQVQPNPWTSMGGAGVAMIGQLLRITDTSTSDGRVYFVDDTAPSGDPDRVVDSTIDFILESRFTVHTYTMDGGNFAGAMAQVFDGVRSVGFMILDVGGTRNVALHADGVVVTQFAFEWNDGSAHTYRLSKSTGGNLVSLFIDGLFVGSAAYSAFAASTPQPIGIVSFGSSTPASMQSTSTVDWTYTNAWRVISGFRAFVGIWKGSDPNALTGYHLPLKGSGREVAVSGNVLADPLANFMSAGVVSNDLLIIDDGPNKGVYTVLSVPGSTHLTVDPIFAVQPSIVSYRIPRQTPWTTAHKYRIQRTIEGAVVIFEDATEIMTLGYNSVDLPSSSVGVPTILAGGMPSIVFGAFDPTNLSQTSWDFVRYGITRSPGEMRIVPHHQVLNQRNVIASPEHLTTGIVHPHTDFWSSSTGIPPATAPDLLTNPGLVAFTLLNEDTPLVPSTQTAEVRHLTTQLVPVASLNQPSDVLNSSGSFTLNNGAFEFEFVVPDDVLYNSLQVIETDTGTRNLLAPADDLLLDLGTFSWQDEVCLVYTGDTLPEQDTTASTPWMLASDDPSHVTRSAFSGTLTYGTDGTGTRTVYKNVTPLLGTTLNSQVSFRLKVLNDSTGGTGDSQIRVGFSAAGITMALALVTSGLGQRYILVYDLTANRVVGGAPFNFLDGNFHTYQIAVSPSGGTVTITVDG